MKKLLILSLVLLISAIGFAQKNTGKTVKADTAKHIMYTCPMHPEVLQAKPGKCPKCGMTLVQKKIVPAAKVFTCPMHSDVISDKPGKCPKCGMTLVEKKAAHTGQMKMK